MRDRIIGTESEFGIHFENHYSRDSHPENVGLGGVMKIFENPTALSIGVRPKFGRLWLPNGGCFYVDMGNLEYASPECRRVRDAVAYHKAGEILVQKIVSQHGAKDGDVVATKTNITRKSDGTIHREDTCGAHENYLVFGSKLVRAFPNTMEEQMSLMSTGSKNILLPLVSFLVTRQILDGCGTWYNARTGEFAFSPRAFFIERDIGLSTTSNRPIINTRSQPHVGGQRSEFPCLHRLHLIVGDPCILDTTLFLKLGTTALVLSLLEGRSNMPRIHMANPVGTIRELSLSYDPKFRIALASDSVSQASMTALEIQEVFCDAVCAFVKKAQFESEESEDEARLICSVWREGLHALANNDLKWMVGRLDHATMKFFSEQEINRRRGTGDADSSQEIRESVDFDYHMLGENNLSARMRKRWPHKCIITDKEIEHAISNPPRDTRAYMRACIVSRAQKGAFRELFSVDWDNVNIQENTGAQSVFWMKNPRVSSEKWFHALMERTKTRG